jgi:hypothetical protein
MGMRRVDWMRIEFMYYDKASCSRCKATDKSMHKALHTLKGAIEDADEKVILKETKLPESKMHLSPSILINGKDIESIVNKKKRMESNKCSDCCKMVGHPVQCRTFRYKGRTYNHIPKGMIVDAIRMSKE